MPKDEDIQIPKWLKELVLFFKKVLCIDEKWHIEIKIVRCVLDDPRNVAACVSTPNVWFCVLYVRSDLEDNFYWWQTVIHEMVHLSQVKVEAVVLDRIIPELAIESRKFAEGVWTDENEKFVDATASSLANIYEFLMENNLLKEYKKKPHRKAIP